MRIAFVWDQYAEYHSDRCEAVATLFGSHAEVLGVEFSQSSARYDWPPTPQRPSFKKITLFPLASFERTTWVGRLIRLIWAIRKGDVTFLAGYQRPDNFFAAILLRLLGHRVVIMNDSKFDDKPRDAWREFVKGFALAPYQAALVAGKRQSDYFRFMGFRGPVETGYDVVSMARLRREAAASALERPPIAPILFVGRFVPKKNIPTLLSAYALYRNMRGDGARPLILVGDGPLRADLERQIQDLGLHDCTRILGFLGSAEVAAWMSAAQCLVVPSTEEQWGLVINEALAAGLPVLASTIVGAAETLVVNGSNGFLIEPLNVEGWAFFLDLLDERPDLRDRLAKASTARSALADSSIFAASARKLIEALR
jgi:glycosyltransferase involved in cell wall biosynthesis